jgi:hypothetical protein
MPVSVPFQPSGWSGSQPCTIFVASWSRPIHLWVALDALWRSTRSPARVILLDNYCDDPCKDRVIAGFERRGLFSEIVRFPDNSFDNIVRGYQDRLRGCGPVHVFLEGDAAIVPHDGCWIETMSGIMAANPRIGMLGSLIDPGDFVVESQVTSKVTQSNREHRFLAKCDSPERAFVDDPSWADPTREFFLTEPPCPIGNPPGRLLMLDTAAMREIGLRTDSRLAAAFRSRGMTPGVTARVRHRHLSLLNVFDYLDYSAEGRDAFFAEPTVRPA